MKSTDVGNKAFPRTWSYIHKAHKVKAERIFTEIIGRVFQDCDRALLCSTWNTSYLSNTTVIEAYGFKIVCEKYSLRDNTYLFCFI